MSCKRMKKRKSENIFNFESFVRAFTVAETILIFIYTRYVASFSISGMRVGLFIICVIVLAGGSLIMSWKYERNIVSLLNCTLLPLLFYESMTMWKYSINVFYIDIAGLIIAILSGLIITKRKALRVRPEKKKKYIAVKSVHTVSLVCCIALFGTCIYGRSLIETHHRVSYCEVKYQTSEEQNNIPDYDNSLSANISEVAKIDPEGGWESLSLQEKTKVLETIIRVECRYLGMRDSAPSLELDYMEEGLLGQYDKEEDVIRLSYNYVVDARSSGYTVIQVLCHELFHRYQKYQVEMLEAIQADQDTEKYSNLLVLDTAGTYKDEFENYITPVEGSSWSYLFYKSQQLEVDAEKYGNESVSEYYEKIQTYLNSENGLGS